MNRKFWTSFYIFTFIIGVIDLLAQIQLVTPIEGVYGIDYVVVNHVDQDTSQNFIDAFCGTKSYNGHHGTDFVIKDFINMDSGVNVLAAYEGVVFKVVDGFFDRNKSTNPSKGFGNWVGIKHNMNNINYYTYYAHLKQGSIELDSGDIVIAGEKIGLVGSSGNSSDPHLHFEIYTDSFLLDPWDGPCQFTPNGNIWKDN